jgi:hypothetical protein
MTVTHFYPDVCDPSPFFLLGQYDLDAAHPLSPVMLHEAMLGAQTQDQPFISAPHLHCGSGSAGPETTEFLFGLLPEQPFTVFPDKLILNLWATEQA